MAIPQRAAKPAAPAPKGTPAVKAATKAPAAKAAVQTPASDATVGEERFTVTKTLLENGQIKGVPVESESIEIRKFLTSTATAAYGLKFRKNLGNYESVEISVFGSLPCYAEDYDNAAGQIASKVHEIFNDEMTSLDVEAFRTEVVGAADFGGEASADEQSVEGTAEAEGDGEITEEWVDEQDRDTLEAFLSENPVEGLDPADYPEDDDLKAMIKSAFFPEEGAEEGATEEAPGYTQEELEASSMEDLKSVFSNWDMGAFPAYTAKNQAIVKKNAIKKILDKQAAGG